MELSDSYLWTNRDWDPNYLLDIFHEDFNDCSTLWRSDLSDLALLKEVENMEKYSPIVEDISMDDTMLCYAVEQIEEEWVYLFWIVLN